MDADLAVGDKLIVASSLREIAGKIRFLAFFTKVPVSSLILTLFFKKIVKLSSFGN